MSNWHFLVFSLGMILGVLWMIFWRLCRIHKTLKDIAAGQQRHKQRPATLEGIERIHAMEIIAQEEDWS